MDGDDGCLPSFFVVFGIILFVNHQCERIASERAAEHAARLAANPPGPPFPWGSVFLILIAILLIIGTLVSIHYYLTTHARSIASQQQQLDATKRAELRERATLEHERKVFAHWQQVKEEDGLAQDAFLKRIQKEFRASIRLRLHRDDQNIYATFRWRGVDGLRGSVHLYQGKERLLQKVGDVEKELGEEGLLATRSLARSGYYRAPITGVSATYFLYWKAKFEGVRPALIIKGQIVETYQRDELIEGYELTTRPYTKVFTGGFRKERLIVPEAQHPLDREEEALDDLERAQYLEDRRAHLTGQKTTDAVSAAAEQAVEEAVTRTKKDADIHSAIEAIQSRDDLSEEAKAQAVATLQSRFSLDDPDFDLEEAFDYET